jgi:hypothetical protein
MVLGLRHIQDLFCARLYTPSPSLPFPSRSDSFRRSFKKFVGRELKKEIIFLIYVYLEREKGTTLSD